MRRETCFAPFENGFEINKLHSPTWKMGDGEMASLREDRVDWRVHQTAKSLSADRDVFGLAGGVWWEGVNTWAVIAEGINSLLLHILEDHCHQQRSGWREDLMSCVLMASGCAERWHRLESSLLWTTSHFHLLSFPGTTGQRERRIPAPARYCYRRWHGQVCGVPR